MTLHLTLRADAVAETLEAWLGFTVVTTRIPSTPLDASTMLLPVWARPEEAARYARCVRSLFLGLEKALKDGLAGIDPYLLVHKPEPTLILALRKDLISRPVPSLLCSRQPFETPGLMAAWRLIRSLYSETLDSALATDFERLLGRLTDIRNRSQHGELYEEPEDLSAVLEQIFARLPAVFRVVNPGFLIAIFDRHPRLESLLTALERKVDGEWQVLYDSLSHGENVLPPTMCLLLLNTDQSSTVLVGTDDVGGLTVWGRVGADSLAGLFAKSLTGAEVEARTLARQASGVEIPVAVPSLSRLFAGVVTALGVDPAGQRALVPLEPGALSIPRASGVITAHLPGDGNQHVVCPVRIDDMIASFTDGNEAQGNLAATLTPFFRKPESRYEPIYAFGDVYLVGEASVTDGAVIEERIPVTVRSLVFDITLSITPRV